MVETVVLLGILIGALFLGAIVGLFSHAYLRREKSERRGPDERGAEGRESRPAQERQVP